MRSSGGRSCRARCARWRAASIATSSSAASPHGSRMPAAHARSGARDVGRHRPAPPRRRQHGREGDGLRRREGAQFVLVVVAGRTLGEAGFGRFSFATNLAVLLAFVTDLGLTTWTTRALARGTDAGAPVLGTGLRLRLWAAIPVALALAGALRGERSRAGGDGRGAGRAYLARGLCDHARAVFRAHERLGDEGKLNAAIAVLAAAAGMAGLWLGAGGLGALATGIMTGTLVGAVYGFLLLGATMVPGRARPTGRWRGGCCARRLPSTWRARSRWCTRAPTSVVEAAVVRRQVGD